MEIKSDTLLLTGNQNETELCDEFDRLRSLIPLENVVNFLRYHRMETLIEFYQKNKKVFDESAMLVLLPFIVREKTYFFVEGIEKEIYEMDQRQYIFLSKQDAKRILQLPQERTNELSCRFKDCFTNIIHTRKRKNNLIIAHDQDKRVRLMDDIMNWKELHVKIAVQEKEIEMNRILYEKEIAFLREQLLQRDAVILNLNQSAHRVQQIPPNLVAPTPTTKRIHSVEKWIGDNQYDQDLSTIPLTNNFEKWTSLFENPLINDIMLYNAIRCHVIPNSHKIILCIPLTYRYRLRDVINIVAEQCGLLNNPNIMKLMKLCPSDYSVVLYNTGEPPLLDEAPNRQNFATIACHCHFIVAGVFLSKSETKWEPRLIDQPPQSYVIPDFDIMDRHYPASTYFGHRTYIWYNMGLCAKNLHTSGTGNNKNCPFCQTHQRICKQKDAFQIAHQVKTCFSLATLSNNEAHILLAIMNGCRDADKKRANALSTHGFLFGVDKKVNKNAIHLNHNTLLRHATDEEIANGQHINGLRLNKHVYIEMRKDLYGDMLNQFEGKIFKNINPYVCSLMSYIYTDAPIALEKDTPVSSLIYDSRGLPFFDSKFDTITKKPLRNFENDDGLYFSLTQQPYSENMTTQAEFFSVERDRQNYFLNQRFMNMMPITDF